MLQKGPSFDPVFETYVLHLFVDSDFFFSLESYFLVSEATLH